MELLLAIGKIIVAYAPQLAGILIPPIVDWLNRDVHTAQEKFIVTLLVCGAFAVATHWNSLLMGSADQVFASFVLVFAESQVIYNLYFKTSGLRNRLLEGLKVQYPEVTERP